MATSLLVLFFALAAVVVRKLLASANSSSGMLAGSVGGAAEPERVQLVALTLMAAATYASQCLATLKTGQPRLIEPDTWIVDMAGASNLTYVVGKALRLT